jgi:hypothetical protein
MKQVYELTKVDLEENPLWYFPMDGSNGGDEMSVCPVTSEMSLPVAYQMIVRSKFYATHGAVFPGYVYWSAGQRVSDWKPTMWIGDVVVTFWNGIVPPDASYLARVHERLAPQSWPIVFTSESVRGLISTTGTVDGVYFLEGGAMKCVTP